MILVLGETGQVARELRRLDPSVRCLPRQSADLAQPSLAAAAVSAALEATGATAVINAAAYTAVDGAEAEAALATKVNAEAPGAIARTCAAHGVPLVHLSTEYVFDGTGDAPRAPDAPPAPLGAYGRSKLDGEVAVRAAGGAHVVLRTSWVFSVHGTNFLKTMLQLSETRSAVSVVADQVGGPTPAAAVAKACMVIAHRLSREHGLSGTYHFAGTPDVSWAGFARAIFVAAGRDTAVTEIPTTAYPTPARRPLNSRLECTATEAAFGLIRPDWRAALPQILAELAETT
ncbi:MAG: dTDP-4-dehydrorhamnose reductase [Pseudomonadota bacterium]